MVLAKFMPIANVNRIGSSVSPTHQDLSNDTTFSQIESRVPVPLIGWGVGQIQIRTYLLVPDSNQDSLA